MMHKKIISSTGQWLCSFLAQCGVLYCAREQRHEDVGLATRRTLIPLEMLACQTQEERGF